VPTTASRAKRGISPTEEAFQQARDLGIDVLVLVQDGVDREPAQEELLARVRGSWEQGNFTANFSDRADLALAAVKTLNAWQRGGGAPTRARVPPNARRLSTTISPGLAPPPARQW